MLVRSGASLHNTYYVTSLEDGVTAYNNMTETGAGCENGRSGAWITYANPQCSLFRQRGGGPSTYMGTIYKFRVISHKVLLQGDFCRNQ